MHLIEERTQNVFQKIFDNEDLQITQSMTSNDLDNWDSLTHVHLIMALEKEFLIRFNSAEIPALKSVGDLIELIRLKLEEKVDFAQ